MNVSAFYINPTKAADEAVHAVIAATNQIGLASQHRKRSCCGTGDAVNCQNNFVVLKQ